MHPSWLHRCSMKTLHISVFYFILSLTSQLTLWLKFFATDSTPTKRRGEELGKVSISAGNPLRSRQMIFRSAPAPIKCPVQSRVLCLSGRPLLLPLAKWAPLNVQLDSTIPHRKAPEQRQHGREEGHDGFILFLPATHAAHTSITGPADSTSRQHLGCDLSQVLRR